MTVIQVKIPEKLWQRLQETGRPVEDVVVEALEREFESFPEEKEEASSREQIVRRLLDSGTVVAPNTWEDHYAHAWLARPENEREKLVEEMNQEWHPGSLASRVVAEGRR